MSQGRKTTDQEEYTHMIKADGFCAEKNRALCGHEGSRNITGGGQSSHVSTEAGRMKSRQLGEEERRAGGRKGNISKVEDTDHHLPGGRTG